MFRYIKNVLSIKEKIELESAVRAARLIEEAGFEKIVEQSDKLGSDWITYKLGNVTLRRDYVEQENPTGTEENPIEWTENVVLIPNAFYVLDGVRKVWTGESGAQDVAWTDYRWEVW